MAYSDTVTGADLWPSTLQVPQDDVDACNNANERGRCQQLADALTLLRLNSFEPVYSFAFTAAHTGDPWSPTVASTGVGLAWASEAMAAEIRSWSGDGTPLLGLVGTVQGVFEGSNPDHVFGLVVTGSNINISVWDFEVAFPDSAPPMAATATATIVTGATTKGPWASAPCAEGIYLSCRGNLVSYIKSGGTWTCLARTAPAAANWEQQGALSSGPTAGQLLAVYQNAGTTYLRLSSDYGTTWGTAGAVTGFSISFKQPIFEFSTELNAWVWMNDYYGNVFTCPAASNPAVWANWTQQTPGTPTTYVLGTDMMVRSGALIGQSVVCAGGNTLTVFDGFEACLASFQNTLTGPRRIVRNGYDKVYRRRERIIWVKGGYNGFTGNKYIGFSQPICTATSIPGAFYL